MKPVFIGGCHRSGTTLLGALLGAHPSCLTTPESQFKTEVLDGIGLPMTDDDMRIIGRRALEARSLSRWGLSPIQIREAEQRAGADYGRFLSRLVDEYSVQLGRTSYDLWIDHTPKNVRHLKNLFSLFPDGRAIHLVRDGRGVAASVLPLDWGPNTILSAAHWWIHHVGFGLAAESCFGESQVLRVRYEDLVATPKTELERICEWLGIPYISDMSQGGGFEFAQGAFRYHALIHEAPDSSRAAAWRQSLSEREIRTFESRVSDMLPYLGYELLFQDAETATVDRIRVALLEPILIAMNAVRFRYWRGKKERLLSRSVKSEERDV